MAINRVGPAPFGYQRQGSMFVAHPDESPVLVRIFELFAEEKRKRPVAEILNADKKRTRGGALFSGQTLGRYLADPRYKGVPDEAEALVSTELWDKCNEIIKGQDATGGAKRKIVHLFAGYVFCGCGQKMYVPTDSEKYVCSDCREKIPADDLEAVYVSQLESYNTTASGSDNKTNLSALWPKISFQNKREIIELLTGRIEVKNRDVRLYLLEF